MDLKETFEALCALQDKPWNFEYARRDYQNLIDSTNFISDTLNNYANDETIFFCDPIKRGKTKAGADTFSGSFMVLTRSDHDETYEERYTKFIKPIIPILLGSFRNKLGCEFDISLWDSIEIINAFDWNADGLMITYNLLRP